MEDLFVDSVVIGENFQGVTCSVQEHCTNNTVTRALRPRIVKPAATVVARERLCKRALLGHVIAAADTHSTTEELWDEMFSVRSLPRLYNDYQLSVRESSETAVRRVGGWREMADSLQGLEPTIRGTSAVWRGYRAAQ